jgi:hypothetical protein
LRPSSTNLFCTAKVFYSITSSALASIPGGTSMPSARAVCRLMANMNLVDFGQFTKARFEHPDYEKSRSLLRDPEHGATHDIGVNVISRKQMANELFSKIVPQLPISANEVVSDAADVLDEHNPWLHEAYKL